MKYIVQKANKQIQCFDNWADAFQCLRGSMWLRETSDEAREIFDNAGKFTGVYGFSYGLIRPCPN